MTDQAIKTNLAYAYKILAKLGWDDLTYTHLSARPEGADYYYIFPFGQLFEEVEVDGLLKVSLDGEVLEGEEYQYNQTGYVIHGAIYKRRPDLNAVFHLHTVHSVAVSALKEGLMPISQWALHFYNNVAYHNYNSLALDEVEHGSSIVKDLGDKKVMLMRHHGMLAAGATVHEAMFYTYHLERACRAQIATLSAGREIEVPAQEICAQAGKDLINFEKDLGARDWEAWLRWVKK